MGLRIYVYVKIAKNVMPHKSERGNHAINGILPVTTIS